MIFRFCRRIAEYILLFIIIFVQVEHEGQPLQTAITSEAYFVIEKYQKYPPGQELIQVLANVARKPKSLQEIIQQADTTTIIKMVESGDANQKHWFEALMGTQVLGNESSRKCIEKHYNLCSQADVDRLLNMSGRHPNNDTKKLILKCVSNLPSNDLIPVITRYFRKFGINTALEDGNIKEQLILLLNKIKEGQGIDDAFIKEVGLLLLQNPEEVLTHLYTECLKNSIYTSCLREVFEKIRQIVIIDNLAIIILNKVINDEIVVQNMQQLLLLLQMKIATGCVTYNKLIFDIILPTGTSFLAEEKYESLQNVLQIFNVSREIIVVQNHSKQICRKYILLGISVTVEILYHF